MQGKKVMVGLEERLREDQDGSLLADVRNRLNTIQARLDGEQKKMHSLQELPLIHISEPTRQPESS